MKVGHWESDNLEGKHGDKTVISTTIDRTTRYTVLTKLAERSAEEKYSALVRRLSIFPEKVRQILTTDNGSENVNHKALSRALNMPVYFCHPYNSREKGSVENTNGKVRRCIHKGTSIDAYTRSEIATIERKLNKTPRRCLGYKTPGEVMFGLVGKNTTYNTLPQVVRA